MEVRSLVVSRGAGGWRHIDIDLLLNYEFQPNPHMHLQSAMSNVRCRCAKYLNFTACAPAGLLFAFWLFVFLVVSSSQGKRGTFLALLATKKLSKHSS